MFSPSKIVENGAATKAKDVNDWGVKQEDTMKAKTSFKMMIGSLVLPVILLVGFFTVTPGLAWGLMLLLPVFLPIAGFIALAESAGQRKHNFSHRVVFDLATIFTTVAFISAICFIGFVVHLNSAGVSGHGDNSDPTVLVFWAIVATSALQVLTNLVMLAVFRNASFVYTLATCLVVGLTLWGASAVFHSMMMGI